jgi:hypothetical protein
MKSIFPTAAALLCLSTLVAHDQPGSTDLSAPPAAAAAGYVDLTFSSSFSNQTVDLGGTHHSRFQWFPWNFFSAPSSTEAIVLNQDGSINLGSDSAGTAIASASIASRGRGWTGTAFGGGGYFEATLKFDPARTIEACGQKCSGWPAFWSLSVEHAAQLPEERWRGQPAGYTHYVEPDFFEYDVWSFSPRTAYGGAIHEWWGAFRSTCPNKAFCGLSNAGGDGTKFSNFVVRAPGDTDFTNYHRFGFLWIPATATTDGYAQYFFDDRPTEDRVTWARFNDEEPPPGKAPWTFGILDRQHLVLVLGSGAKQPMTVSSVRVWQTNASGNLTR